MGKDQIERREYKDRYLSLAEITQLLNCSRNAIYKWMKLGMFPPGIRVGIRARRWSEAQIHDFAQSRGIQVEVSQESRGG